MPDPLPADLAIAFAAAGSRIAPFDRVEYHASVASTSTLAQQRAAAGAPHGFVVIAGEQGAGRGRQGRAWFSPPGAGLYMSIVVRTAEWHADLSLITLGAGVAVARGLERATGLRVELKWPNDVVIGRPWRKLAGILCESVAAGAQVDAVVVGVGVNVRASAFPSEIAARATAIELETDRRVEPAQVTVEILVAIAELFEDARAVGAAAVIEPWRAYGRAGLAGAAVRWNDERGARRGTSVDIDLTGALVVESPEGRQCLVAGDVSWERLSRD